MVQPEGDAVLVLCHGRFDILHPGHIAHLSEAREMGDKLIVSITADEFITKPRYFSELERAGMLKALRCVDEVFICHAVTGALAIRECKPKFYVKGIDYKQLGIDEEEFEACIKYGAELRFTDSEKRSSSEVKRWIGATHS